MPSFFKTENYGSSFYRVENETTVFYYLRKKTGKLPIAAHFRCIRVTKAMNDHW
jgi:hypothetical protein